MKKETSKKLSAGLLASAIVLNTVLSINAAGSDNYHSASESGVEETYVSVPLGVTIGYSGADLKEGNFEKWIDRAELPDYAIQMYNTLSDETFWTNADNFSDSASSTTYFNNTYSNGVTDEFNGLMVYESPSQTEYYSAEDRKEIHMMLRTAYDAFDRDNPDIFWLTGETNFKSIVTFEKNGDVTTYTMKTYLVLKDYVDNWDMRIEAYQDTSALDRAIGNMDDAVEQIIKGAGEDATDYEKIKYFNEYLIENNDVNYYDNPSDTAEESYSAILCGKDEEGPLREAYSRAFKVLCDEAGIPCLLTSGRYSPSQTPWMWNYAKVGDKWYVVDLPLSEEAGETDKYLLAGSESIIAGLEIRDTYDVENMASVSGTAFTNGPELSREAYVPSDDEKVFEAIIDDKKYETFEEAAAAASSGKTIKLLENITRNNNITIGASGSIDLDGKTIDMGEYTITAENPVTIKDSESTGSVIGNFIFKNGGEVSGAAMDSVVVSGGDFAFSNASADTLSITGGTAAISDSELSGISASPDLCSVLAAGQMYFIDGTVISADKLYGTALSGNITVDAGKATGLIENKDYALVYTYDGLAVTAPTKDNFTYYGADPVFVWNTADGSAPVDAGVYNLTVSSAETDRVDAASRTFEVKIDEYASEAVATLTGTEGNNGWLIADAKLVAPDGYKISTEKNGLYADYISFEEDTNKTVEYFLKENATGIVLSSREIQVKVDVTDPVLSADASFFKLTASEASMMVTATDGDGSGIAMYHGKLGNTEISSTAGRFNLIDLAPATEYVLKVTVMDVAGNTSEGEIKFTTKTGVPGDITPPTLTGTYGTAVKNMTISGGTVKYGSEIVDGVWTITDANAHEIPEVGAKNAYTLTFIPSSPAYESVPASVIPVILPLSIENAVISGIEEGYSYTSDPIQPVPIVTLGGVTLEDTGYVVEYGLNINCGENAGKITVKGKGNYTGTVTATFDINKIDTEISAVTTTVIRNFGDKAFTLDVKTNNTETLLNYRVTNTDVVEVSEKGLVTIKGAGTTAIFISQDETQNYKANISGVSVFITVLPAEALRVDDVTMKFVYSVNSKGEVDMAEVMRAASDEKCGPMTFSAYENSALIDNARISDDGILTFDVGKGDIGDKGTVVVTVYSQNYDATTIKVIAELTNKFPTNVKGKISAANNIIYGQPLSDIGFKDATFVSSEGDTVKGTLSWKEPETIPSVSQKNATWVFTPENTDVYEPCEGTVSIVVKQAVPAVKTPVFEKMVYDAERKLSDVAISGENGKAKVNGEEVTVAGTWSWAKPATVPNCKTSEYVAVFTPEDTVNYEDVEVKAVITVTKADAVITKAPTAADITYGQKVSASVLKNGAANTAGKFSWAYGDTMHPAGEYKEEVVFTPSDKTNYNEVTIEVELTVKKAKDAPDMPASRINASYDLTTVGEVELPDNWYWDNSDAGKALTVGSGVTATAIYDGRDKGNYENEKVLVTITRSKCSHKNTKTINAKDATCLEKGYTGDTYCEDCDTIIVKGKDIPLAEHSGGQATCSSLAVCKYCKKTYGEYDRDRHSGVKVIRNAIAPTETSAGYTGDVCCSDCGAVLEKGEIIPSSGAAATTPATSSPVWNDITTTTKATTTTSATTTKATTTTKNTTTTTPPDEDGDDDYEDDDSKYDEEAPYIFDDDEKYGWDDIIKEIDKAKSGSTVEVDMNYTTALPAKVLKALKGKNVELVLHMDDYFSWVINGMNIESAKDINMEVVEGEDNIEAEIIDQVTGDAYSTTITLTHNGEFGFTAVLRYDASEPGYYANLYYYNPTKKVATFVVSDKIDDEGYAELTFNHASDYIIVIDEKDHSSRAGIEYDGGGEDDDDDEYEGSEDVTIDDGDNDDLFDNGNDYYTGGDKNPSTGLGFGHILVGILGVSAFVVRPKNEKRKRKTL